MKTRAGGGRAGGIAALALALAVGLSAPTTAFATGAIAVDDLAGSKPSDAGYGIGFGDTKEGAEAAAMSKCKEFGNEGCKIAVWFDKCGAYASSNDKYGIGWGGSQDAAKEKAMAQCGNDACHVVAADCGD